MSLAHATATILAKELRTEFRSRELLGTTIVFVLIVIVLFSFTFDPTSSESRRFGPGLLWLAFLFAGSLMLQPSFLREQINDTLAALRLAPIDPFSILAGKMAANFLFLLLVELLLLPVLAPVLIASTEATAGILRDPSELSLVWLTFLTSSDVVFLTAAWLFGEYLLEE